MMKLIVLVAILAIGCGAKAEKINGVDGVDPKVEAEMKKLTPYFIKLTEELKEKLSKEDQGKLYAGYQESAVKCIEIAKQKLDELSSIGCIGACLKPNRSEKKALALFVSLEKTLGKCDTESYDILVRNYLAHMPLGHIHRFHATYLVIEYYRMKHTENCGPVYKRRFAEGMQHVYLGDDEKIEKAFSGLDIYQFSYNGIEAYDSGLLGMQKPKFTDSFVQDSLVEITRQIAQQSLDTPWRSRYVEPKPEHIETKSLKGILDTFLFEPCKNYRKQLATVLTEARFDATIERNGIQAEFLHGDGKFYRAMINNRLCGSLLDEREKLYEPLAKAWMKMLHP